MGKDEYIGLLHVLKFCETRRITSSLMITSKPAYLFFVSICPTDADSLYEAKIHNGETSNAEILLDIEAKGGQNPISPQAPIFFDKGIYVACTTNVKSVTIQILEDIYT